MANSRRGEIELEAADVRFGARQFDEFVMGFSRISRNVSFWQQSRKIL
jgi:hypothetical protein